MAGRAASLAHWRARWKAARSRTLGAAGLLLPLVILPDTAASAATPATITTPTTTPATTSPATTSPATTSPTTAPRPASTPSPTVTLTPPSTASPLVGAYYSDWYPANAAQGTLRAHLVPPPAQLPGNQNNADPAVAEKAISQASQNGIDFFAMDYWPTQPAQNANIDAFLRADNIADMKFCIFYETWDIGVTRAGSTLPTANFDVAHEATPVNPAMEASFDADMVTFAQKYFNNPSYLKIDGRPVLDLYLTRTLTGDVAGMIHGARQTLEALGYNPYIIGDEIFWRVTPVSAAGAGAGLTQTPQTSRIWDFDAITSYSLYSSGSNDPLAPDKDFSTYPGQTTIVEDESNLYKRYAAATGGEVPVIPDATPGEDTRGVRLTVNEHPQPRQWLPGQGPATTLEHFLDQIARPEIDPRVPMVFITTWNEWNEDTGIEPVGGARTTKDDSPTGNAYTQGYSYGEEGNADLTVIRNFVGVAFGQVTDPAGRPLAHTVVQALSHGVVVSTTETNAQGWYVMHRTSQTTGPLAISAHHFQVTIHPSITTAIRANLLT